MKKYGIHSLISSMLAVRTEALTEDITLSANKDKYPIPKKRLNQRQRRKLNRQTGRYTLR